MRYRSIDSSRLAAIDVDTNLWLAVPAPCGLTITVCPKSYGASYEPRVARVRIQVVVG